MVSVVRLPATSAYTNLGDVEPDNLLSFAFQIASGMVCIVCTVIHIHENIVFIIVFSNTKLMKYRGCTVPCVVSLFKIAIVIFTAVYRSSSQVWM